MGLVIILSLILMILTITIGITIILLLLHINEKHIKEHREYRKSLIDVSTTLDNIKGIISKSNLDKCAPLEDKCASDIIDKCASDIIDMAKYKLGNNVDIDLNLDEYASLKKVYESSYLTDGTIRSGLLELTEIVQKLNKELNDIKLKIY